MWATMAFYKLLIFAACATVARCEDNCVFDLKRGDKHFQFDLTHFERIQTVNFNKSTDFYSINIKLCKSDEQESKCDGIRSKLCLIKNKNNEIDIGSKIKEVKLDVKDQLVMSLEGNTVCETDQKYTTDIICICNKNIVDEKIVYKSGIGICKYIIELISIAVCPVDDSDIRRVCDVSIPHYLYKFNLNPLRRLTNNYLVENHNRRFEVNICGRLNDNNKCGSNITTICDITDAVPKKYAVGYSKNDKLLFNASSKHLIIIHHEKATKIQKGRKIEFTFKCDENIPPEKTKPEFIYEGKINEHNANVAYFEVATSTVCIPRILSCEIFTNMKNFNLKPLHKRVGNRIVTNEKDGGYFYLNVCDYLNQYDEKIPSSCTADGKTSVCYMDKLGRGIPVGSSQIGPYTVGNSMILNYTDGENCTNALKWSTVINFTCSNESQLKHDSTDLTTCTHLFQWKTHKACEVLFERKDKCLVTLPGNSETVYNMSSLKDYSFEVTDDEDDAKFRFSICSPLQTPCNGYLDSSACWSDNGMEKNIGIFTDQVVFDNGTIYMSMNGEKCVNGGPNSYTTVRFVCDYLDSKLIDFKKDLRTCTFDFIIHTKHACTPPSKINCTVKDELGNINYDLSELTKFNTNYEISFGYKKKIVLNVCHSVINNGYSMDNNIDGINCQFRSGICLVDSNSLSSSNWYKNLGDVNEGPHRDKNTIKLEMINGFYDNNKTSSVIEFVCSNHTEGPVLLNNEDNVFKFRWLTPLACPISRQKQKKELFHDVNTITNYVLDGLGIYSIYVCSKNDIDRNCNLDTYSDNVVDHHSKLGQKIILTVNKEKKIYTLGINSYFVYNSNKTCDKKKKNSEQVLFKFICGFEHQSPKVILKELCKTKVLIIDPKICDKKLECSVNSYDLTPIQGHYIVYNNGIKYYINMCVPGKNGVGVVMELNGKNYTIGYQSQLPKKSEDSDRVEVVFTDGDYCIDCLEQTKIKYMTKIVFECDNSVHLGKAIFVAAKNGKFQFLWKTSFACFNNKLIEFDKNACAVTSNDHSKDFVNSNINMKNILNTKQFYDDIKNNNYHVDFCTASVCLNTSEKLECFGNMNLQYNVYKNQLIASFKDINGFTKVKMIIECTKSTENLSNANKVLLTDNGEKIINTYSEVMCPNYLLIPISTTTFKTTSYIENESSIKFEYNDFQNSNLEEPTLLNEESDQEPTIRNINTYVQQEHGEKAENSVNKISTMEKDGSSSLFFSGITVLIVIVLIFLTWIFRWKLLKKIRKLFYSRNLFNLKAKKQKSSPKIDQPF